MSTDNVNGLNAARKAIAETAASVIKRDEELRLIRLGLQSKKDEEQRQTLILARALEQEANDKLDRIAEEAGQIDYIRNGHQAATPPAPPEEEVEEVIVPAPAVDVEPEPTIPPAPPEEEVATAVLPTPVAVQTVIVHNNQFNPRGWNWFQWILAILFAFIAFQITKSTVGWVISDLRVWDWLLPWLQGILGFVWCGALIAVGFFGGALAGFRLWNWRYDRGATPTA